MHRQSNIDVLYIDYCHSYVVPFSCLFVWCCNNVYVVPCDH